MEIPKLDKVFKALGNETRMAIFDYIRSTGYDCESGSQEECAVHTIDRTVCVSHISRKFPHMGSTAISQHLKTLHYAGLLNRHKRGSWVYYTINSNALVRLQQYFSESHILQGYSLTNSDIPLKERQIPTSQRREHKGSTHEEEEIAR